MIALLTPQPIRAAHIHYLDQRPNLDFLRCFEMVLPSPQTRIKSGGLMLVKPKKVKGLVP
jgi:hypothetical protein